MTIIVDTIPKGLNIFIKKFKKQSTYALKNSLNNMAFEIKNRMGGESDKHLFKPTPFTKKGFIANKVQNSSTVSGQMFSSIMPKNDTAWYLGRIIKGGTRTTRNKSYPLVVPNDPGRRDQMAGNPKFRKNKYGNIPDNRIEDVLSQPDIFQGTPNGTKYAGIEGIWQRKKNRAGKTTELRLLLRWQDKKAKYRKFLPFPEISTKRVQERFGTIFKANLYKAFSTMK